MPASNKPNPERIPEGTCRIEVVGVPTTPEDLRVIRWALANAVVLEEEVNFNMPYHQGGGLIRITKLTLAEAQACNEPDPMVRAEEGPWGWRTEEAELNYGSYTGWCFNDFYSDSMGGPYWSPIFNSTDSEADYYTWEY